MCKEGQATNSANEGETPPPVDPNLVVQGTREGRPKVDARLVVNLKASEPIDPDSVKMTETESSGDGAASDSDPS